MKLARALNPNFLPVLNKLAKEQLPLPVAFKLKKAIKKVDEQLNIYEDLRKNALTKFGDKNEDGTLKLDEKRNVQFSKENIEQFAKEISEVVNGEMEGVEFPTIKLTDLTDGKFSVEELVALEDLLVE